MDRIVLVGVGGFIGSVLRYLLSGYVQDWTKSPLFPYGTLTVNLVGCLIIGFCSQLADIRGFFSAEARLLVFVGLLGGFTTFSAFGYETINLLRHGAVWVSLTNIAAHLLLGLGAVWLGHVIAHLLVR